MHSSSLVIATAYLLIRLNWFLLKNIVSLFCNFLFVEFLLGIKKWKTVCRRYPNDC